MGHLKPSWAWREDPFLAFLLRCPRAGRETGFPAGPWDPATSTSGRWTPVRPSVSVPPSPTVRPSSPSAAALPAVTTSRLSRSRGPRGRPPSLPRPPPGCRRGLLVDRPAEVGLGRLPLLLCWDSAGPGSREPGEVGGDRTPGD